MRRLLFACFVALATIGCGTSGSGAAPVETPSGSVTSALATPNALNSVDCPGTGGPDGGALSGLGATLCRFRSAHGPQDSAASAEFGVTITGGSNDGLHEFSAQCSTLGIVVSVNQYLAKAASAAVVKKALKGYGILPADAKLLSDETPLPCEFLIYKSASLAVEANIQHPDGTFLVELQASIQTPDLKHVDSLIYDLDTTGGC
ncbi:MAG: hypothetical protein M3082_06570 [Candidatus Dormibacteraeota bacterium]|nr:hypothetical protein [Candidatus Dormibacteraeota bacterium]